MLHANGSSLPFTIGFVTISLLVTSPTTHAADWDSRFGGANGLDRAVFTIEADGDNIYVGGDFRNAGGLDAVKMARWDGSQWHSLSSDISDDGHYVTDIAIIGGDVYACGTFTSLSNVPANRVARWDGSQWHAMGAGSPSGLFALAVVDGELYAGGFNWFSRWDGAAWQTVATLGPSQRINSIYPYGTDLYVAGNFSTIGGLSIIDLARWNGTVWSAVDNPLGNACTSQVNEVLATGSNLFVCGEFLSEIGDPELLRNVAVWNGSDLVALGLGVHRTETYPCDEAWANAVVEFEGERVFGGWWETAGGQPIPYLARWDGSEWAPIGSGVNNAVTALLAHNGKLYVGGSFTMAGGKLSNHFGIFDPGLPTAVRPTSASGLELGQNIPNPFNPETTIPYTLRQAAEVTLEVLNVEGRVVRTLVDQHMTPGNYAARWNGRDDGGTAVASGVYFFRLTDGAHSLVQKAVLVK